MPTLGGFNGASVVPNITGALQQGGQAFGAVRQLGRENVADDAAVKAAAGDMDALALLSRLDPNAGQLVGNILQNKDAKAAAELAAQKEKRVREAAAWLQADPKDRQTTLLQMATSLRDSGEDFSHLVNFSQLDPQRQEAEARRIIAMGAGIDQVLKPLMSEEGDTSLIRNLRAAGIDPSSPEGQQLIRDSIMKPSTQVNVGSQQQGGGFGADQSKFAEVLATKQAEQWSKQTELADKADENIALAEEMESLLDSGLETGALAPIRAGTDNLTQSAFGFSLTGTDPAKAQRFEGISTRLSRQMRQPGEGNMTDKDAEAYMKIIGGLGNDVAANRAALEAYKKVQIRNQDKAREMDQWIEKNGSLTGFKKYWDRYMEENPLFEAPANDSVGGRKKSLEDLLKEADEL